MPRENLIQNVNQQDFEVFFSNLVPTNRTLDFYVDFNKCLKNKNEISYQLYKLNYLLNKENLLEAIKFIFNREGSEVFNILNLLIAVRDNRENIIFDNQFVEIKECFKTPESVYKFIQDSGLEIIFKDNIKDLNDYVFGIEVGMDTNARKNRSGKNMENYFENLLLREKFIKNKDFYTQVKNNTLDENVKKILGIDVKKFDFVIRTKKNNYYIEINFFGTNGSKPNETDRSYISIAQKFQNLKNDHFIWITDGYGWKNSKNTLKEAYSKVCMYNLANLNYFIEKLKNENI
ncbi:DpnII family type II restriction endonuclease [Campylobacter aviculae]|uniref:Type-2 restriction enzyme n=1 Tax=Campylobacter aviculae TaxID=2510190 RepID=A0A4U7BH73_9BACT|nr:DpnII family type II restriction endonuclease [Campylobacter aviculae]TKX30729.1 restriction endonuclease [Campylobacter aviculae]